jgi:hypothetical protein
VDAGLAAVIGAGIGGATAIVGSFATTVLSARATRSQWRRSQAADGYANSLRYLTRAVAVRSRFTSRGRAVLSKDDVHQFFVDLADAEHSLAIAAAFSGLRARPLMLTALGDLSRRKTRRPSSMKPVTSSPSCGESRRRWRCAPLPT